MYHIIIKNTMEDFIMQYEKIKKFTKLFLDMMFYAGILVLITVPIWLKYAGKMYSSVFAEHYIAMVLIFGISGICGLIIVGELRKMMRTVLCENCFVQENVTSLRKMGKISIVISISYAAKILFIPTPATFVIVLVFFIAALFSIVLSCVFQEAINYKEENDLTI